MTDWRLAPLSPDRADDLAPAVRERRGHAAIAGACGGEKRRAGGRGLGARAEAQATWGEGFVGLAPALARADVAEVERRSESRILMRREPDLHPVE